MTIQLRTLLEQLQLETDRDKFTVLILAIHEELDRIDRAKDQQTFTLTVPDISVRTERP